MKVEKATLCKLSDVNSELIPESRKLAYATTLAQLQTEKELISQLNNGISTIEEEGELEAKLTDANLYLSELEEKLQLWQNSLERLVNAQ